MKYPLLYILIFALSFSCTHEKESSEKDSTSPVNTDSLTIKNHSYSNVDDVFTKHIHLDLTVDFEKQIISGVARHEMVNNGSTVAIFDINGIEIEKITTGSSEKETEVQYSIGKNLDYFGAPLAVKIEEDDTFINIYYRTTENSNALDWLAADKTGNQELPFLYTQGQAILTRSWIPIQDVPGNRFTYSADIQVPTEMLAVMSAENPTEKNDTGLYHFEMSQPISSYLLSMAVGDLEYRAFDDKSGVYAEPNMIKAAASEFKDLPKMIAIASDLFGEYKWEQYDILVLPFSFPFGGMENPRLTFVTPTLIAGDRSLINVVAHELAHSWSGNLVTNATWDDFWLNEGFTTYIENRIMEKLYGEEAADMMRLIGYQELYQTVEKMEEKGRWEDTHLKLDLSGRNPDDGMTDIAYMKGQLFLESLENEVGRDKLDEFLRNYFDTHQFETMTTEEFIAILNENLLEKENLQFNVDEWVFQAGIPENAIEVTSKRFDEIHRLAEQVIEGENLPSDLKRDDKITQEWMTFIRHFDGKLSPEKMSKIDEQLFFTEEGNAEIQCEWFVLGIQNDYQAIRPALENFLIQVGRRKFQEPLYETLAEANDDWNAWGKQVYEKARPHYHAISSNTIDKILGLKE